MNAAAATIKRSTTTPAAMPPRTATSRVIDESTETKSLDSALGCCVTVKESLVVVVAVAAVVGTAVVPVALVGVTIVVVVIVVVVGVVGVVVVDVVVAIVVTVVVVVVGRAVGGAQVMLVQEHFIGAFEQF